MPQIQETRYVRTWAIPASDFMVLTMNLFMLLVMSDLVIRFAAKYMAGVMYVVTPPDPGAMAMTLAVFLLACTTNTVYVVVQIMRRPARVEVE